jgi:transcriptional regulator with XRE-family HTH domain
MSAAHSYLSTILQEIDEGPFTVSRVCTEAGMNPSVVSRWKKSGIEPRLSSLERLAEAHERLLAKRTAAEQFSSK